MSEATLGRIFLGMLKKERKIPHSIRELGGAKAWYNRIKAIFRNFINALILVKKCFFTTETRNTSLFNYSSAFIHFIFIRAIQMIINIL